MHNKEFSLRDNINLTVLTVVTADQYRSGYVVSIFQHRKSTSEDISA